MTLIAVYTSDGCIGRCDAKCYSAKTKSCTCVCGGKNHGAGLQRAIDNTRAEYAEWLERYAKEHGLPTYEWESPILQTSIFEIEGVL